MAASISPTPTIQSLKTLGRPTLDSIDPLNMRSYLGDYSSYFHVGQNILYYVLKGGLLIFLVIYIIMAAMTLKQVMMMTATIKTASSKFIKLISAIHLILVIICFLYALIFI